MRTGKHGRLVFEDGYERMAYLTLEYATGAQTQTQLAERTGLSHQRVSQIVKAGYARAGQRPGAAAELVGHGLARADAARDGRGPKPDTPEWFYKYERFGEHRP